MNKHQIPSAVCSLRQLPDALPSESARAPDWAQAFLSASSRPSRDSSEASGTRREQSLPLRPPTDRRRDAAPERAGNESELGVLVGTEERKQTDGRNAGKMQAVASLSPEWLHVGTDYLVFLCLTSKSSNSHRWRL